MCCAAPRPVIPSSPTLASPQVPLTRALKEWVSSCVCAMLYTSGAQRFVRRPLEDSSRPTFPAALGRRPRTAARRRPRRARLRCTAASSWTASGYSSTSWTAPSPASRSASASARVATCSGLSPLCLPQRRPHHSPASRVPTHRKLSLSTNNIDRIAPLSGMEKLRVLSLGRNMLKKIGARCGATRGTAPSRGCRGSIEHRPLLSPRRPQSAWRTWRAPWRSSGSPTTASPRWTASPHAASCACST
jgi:hypothetical protein